MTNQDRFVAKEKFRIAPQPFIGAIGAIDCTHIRIVAPHVHEEAYVNHWGDQSMYKWYVFCHIIFFFRCMYDIYLFYVYNILSSYNIFRFVILI